MMSSICFEPVRPEPLRSARTLSRMYAYCGFDAACRMSDGFVVASCGFKLRHASKGPGLARSLQDERRICRGVLRLELAHGLEVPGVGNDPRDFLQLVELRCFCGG